MADILTTRERSERMALIHSCDTAPELIVRRLAHGLGFRYRLQTRSLPGRPDLVFPKYKKVIFVHGCFWHWHADQKCKIARVPSSRQEYWVPKLRNRRIRDEWVKHELFRRGWRSLTLWECELRDLTRTEQRIVRFLRNTSR